MDTRLESPKVSEALNVNKSCTLWVAPNPVLSSLMRDPEALRMNLEGLLISLFSDPAIVHLTRGGTLQVKLGNGWVYDGEVGSRALEIVLILKSKPSEGGSVLRNENR